MAVTQPGFHFGVSLKSMFSTKIAKMYKFVVYTEIKVVNC